jgi:hypothetical protein
VALHQVLGLQAVLQRLPCCRSKVPGCEVELLIEVPATTAVYTACLIIPIPLSLQFLPCCCSLCQIHTKSED